MPAAYWIDVSAPVTDTDIEAWYAVSPDGNFLGGVLTGGSQGIIRTIDSSEADFLIPNDIAAVYPSQFNFCNDILLGQAGDRPVLLTKTAPETWELTVLNPLPGYTYGVDCIAAGWSLDNTGRRAVGYMQDADTGVYHAVLWDDSLTPTDLGTIDGFTGGAIANHISADGSTIVGWVLEEGGGNPQAFLWTEADGMRLLSEIMSIDHGIDLSSYIIQQPTCISANAKHITCFAQWDTGYSTEQRFLYIVLP